MKIKRIISVLCASAAVLGAAGANIQAEDGIDESMFSDDGRATYCFDTSAGLSDWEILGSVSETNIKLQITDNAESGAGALAIYEKIRNEPENKAGYIFLSPDVFGIKNFSGYKLRVSYKFNPDFKGTPYDNFGIFSDGIFWTFAALRPGESDEYQTIELKVPDSAANTRIGFTYPAYTECDGEIVYIDNVSLIDPEGRQIANTGDFKEAAADDDNGFKDDTGQNILLAVVLVVVVLGVVAGASFVILSLKKRFK